MPATVRHRRRDAQANRASLLRAAGTALAVNPHASLDAIAHAAGLPRRALYGHFPDRDSLIGEVIAQGVSRFNEIAVGITDADPRVGLTRLAAALWREASSVRTLASLALDDAHVAATVSVLAPLRTRLRELTAQGVATGVFRGDLPAETLALLIEASARATLAERRLADEGSASAVVRVMLSIAGLSWREQDDLLSAPPELLTHPTASRS